MNYGMIRYIFGWLTLCEGILLLPPVIAALCFGESLTPFTVTIGISLLLGALLLLRKPKNRQFYIREGFVITALGWVIISILGALPFLISRSIPSFVDALFETMSGFTTTGASILSEVEPLPKSVLFWRSETHWIGGMGVLVFLLMIMPKAGGSYTNLMKAESPGPQVEKLVPKVQYTAFILYGIYCALTILEFVILLIAKMPAFDAITLTFGTAGTGGFGVRNDSIAGYTIAQQNIITVFMIVFGVNFNFYYLLLLGKMKKAFGIEEIRWYVLIIAVAILAITCNIYSMVGSVSKALQQAAFQVGSIITTTGYSTVDFDAWPNFSRMIMVLLMICGACAGSTGGGFKVSRFILLGKDLRRTLRSVLNPSRISVTRMDGKVVSKDTIGTANAYLAAYVLIFAVSVFLVGLDGYDLTTNFTAVAATLNNIGPGLNMVGPAANFAFYSWPVKLVLTFCMLAGRLELFPVLVLFSRETWRRH